MAKKAKHSDSKGYNIITTSLNLVDASLHRVHEGSVRWEAERPWRAPTQLCTPKSKSRFVVMCTDAVREPARPGSLFLYTENVDKAFDKAVKAGAKVLMPPQDMFWAIICARRRPTELGNGDARRGRELEGDEEAVRGVRGADGGYRPCMS
jgi:hypothetical protein